MGVAAYGPFWKSLWCIKSYSSKKKKKKEKERAALLNRKGTNRRQEGPFGAAMDSLEYYDEMETRSTPLP